MGTPRYSCTECSGKIQQLESDLMAANYRIQLMEHRYNQITNLVSRLWSGDAEAAIYLFNLDPSFAARSGTQRNDDNSDTNSQRSPREPSQFEVAVLPTQFSLYHPVSPTNASPRNYMAGTSPRDLQTDPDVRGMYTGPPAPDQLQGARNHLVRSKISSQSMSNVSCSSKTAKFRNASGNSVTSFKKIPSRVLKNPEAYTSLPVVNLTFGDPVPNFNQLSLAANAASHRGPRALPASPFERLPGEMHRSMHCSMPSAAALRGDLSYGSGAYGTISSWASPELFVKNLTKTGPEVEYSPLRDYSMSQIMLANTDAEIQHIQDRSGHDALRFPY
ncbi:uncharacterized protein LOC129596251 isoform X2 [Paramacrobiotus metropolitanus]|uniref:uncharacterized protein LOC129596251 isoform X2 n=1 Tax=Paramacrobiotus metropolitanus TaxID=2943436 RepID=UPI00244639B4|nr:uncharacterized protein LOC129596251 isoform X2 [Paramacrobiotus metropolitanus]